MPWLLTTVSAASSASPKGVPGPFKDGSSKTSPWYPSFLTGYNSICVTDTSDFLEQTFFLNAHTSWSLPKQYAFKTYCLLYILLNVRQMAKRQILWQCWQVTSEMRHVRQNLCLARLVLDKEQSGVEPHMGPQGDGTQKHSRLPVDFSSLLVGLLELALHSWLSL